MSLGAVTTLEGRRRGLPRLLGAERAWCCPGLGAGGQAERVLRRVSMDHAALAPKGLSPSPTGDSAGAGVTGVTWEGHGVRPRPPSLHCVCCAPQEPGTRSSGSGALRPETPPHPVGSGARCGPGLSLHAACAVVPGA